MRREFAKSLHLHRAIAQRVAEDYRREAAKACDYLERHRDQNAGAWWFQEWESILSSYNREQLLAILVSSSEYAIDLRSSTPFTRTLSPRERSKVLKEFAKLWAQRKNLNEVTPA